MSPDEHPHSVINSAEVDLLVHSYLVESGYIHTSFSLLHESSLADHPPLAHSNGRKQSPDSPFDLKVPPGHLVRILHKGLLYLEAEARYRGDPEEPAPRLVGYPIPNALPLPPLPKNQPIVSTPPPPTPGPSTNGIEPALPPPPASAPLPPTPAPAPTPASAPSAKDKGKGKEKEKEPTAGTKRKGRAGSDRDDVGSGDGKRPRTASGEKKKQANGSGSAPVAQVKDKAKEDSPMDVGEGRESPAAAPPAPEPVAPEPVEEKAPSPKAASPAPTTTEPSLVEPARATPTFTGPSTTPPEPILAPPPAVPTLSPTITSPVPPPLPTLPTTLPSPPKPDVALPLPASPPLPSPMAVDPPIEDPTPTPPRPSPPAVPSRQQDILKVKEEEKSAVVPAKPAPAPVEEKEEGEETDDDVDMKSVAPAPSPAPPVVEVEEGEEEEEEGVVKEDDPPVDPLAGVVSLGVDDGAVVRLRGHTLPKVQPCSWNPKVPTLLATGGGDSTCRIWDVPAPARAGSPGGVLVKDNVVCKHSSAQRRTDVAAVAWDPSGSLLATGSEDGIARIWTPSGDLHLVLSMHQRTIFSLKWNSVGTMLLTGSLDNTVCLWELNSGKVKQQWSTHSDSVLDVDWNDDSTFASASMDKSIHLFNVSRVSPVHRFKGHRDEVNVVKFSPCGTLLASCSDDYAVRIWSLRHIPGFPLDRSRDAPEEGRTIDDKEHAGVFILEGHTKDVHTLAWAPWVKGQTTPRLLASASFDTKAKLWDADAGTCLHTFSRHSDYVYSISFSPGSGAFLVTGSDDGKMCVWNVKERRLVFEYTNPGPIYEVAWNPSGTQLAVCGRTEDVAIVGFEPAVFGSG